MVVVIGAVVARGSVGGDNDGIAKVTVALMLLLVIMLVLLVLVVSHGLGLLRGLVPVFGFLAGFFRCLRPCFDFYFFPFVI